MKTLDFHRDEKGSRTTVMCADGEVSVHSHCGYCRHCKGVRMGSRTIPTPQQQALSGVRQGMNPDENLMNAAIMFNTIVRDGSAIECSDDENAGFKSLYRY